MGKALTAEINSEAVQMSGQQPAGGGGAGCAWPGLTAAVLPSHPEHLLHPPPTPNHSALNPNLSCTSRLSFVS